MAGALTLVCLLCSCGWLLLWCGRFLWAALRFAYPIRRSALAIALHLRLAVGFFYDAFTDPLSTHAADFGRWGCHGRAMLACDTQGDFDPVLLLVRTSACGCPLAPGGGAVVGAGAACALHPFLAAGTHRLLAWLRSVRCATPRFGVCAVRHPHAASRAASTWTSSWVPSQFWWRLAYSLWRA